MEKRVYTQEEFESDYREVLEELKKRPRENPEEKIQCWDWFRDYLGLEGYQKFAEDIIRVFRPKAYEWLQNYAGENTGSVLDEASCKMVEKDKSGKQMDPLVFMEALKEAVKEYSGRNSSGESYSFIASVGQKYGQKAYHAAGENDYKNSGMLPAIPERNMAAVLKLAKNIDILMQKCNDDRMLSNVVKEALEGVPGHNYTKADIDAAIRMYQKLNLVTSLDMPISEDNEDSLESMIQDKDDKYEELTEGEMLRAFFEKVGKNWGKVKGATKKEARNWLRVFMTKDILIALKLDVLPELSKQEKKLWRTLEPEPACGQWCPKKSWCKKDKRISCFARYTENPAGNCDVYMMLKPYEEIVYKELFHPDYVDRAIEMNPKDLDEVYENLLKNDFNFSDKILADVMMKNKGTVSNKRKEYEKVRRQLFKLCADNEI